MIPRPHYANARPAYEGARQLLAPSYRHLPAAEIESLLESAGIDPEYADSIWTDIGSTLTKAAPTILPILGAAVGTVVGGPVGTALGGTLGNLAGQAVGAATAPRPARAPKAGTTPRPARPQSRPARQPAPRQAAAPRPIVAPHQPVAPPVASPAVAQGRTYVPIPVPTAAPATQEPATTDAPASAQLLDLLARPELAQALVAMTLGQAGAPEIPVGDEPVPLGAFTNLLGQLAEQAAAEYHMQVGGSGEMVGNYLEGLDESEAALPEVRANRLLSLFQEADVQRQAAYESASFSPEEAMEAMDAYYDELELTEFYEQYEF